MTKRASGTFAVQLKPQPPDASASDSGIGRLSIDKQFQGELEGTSQGQMLAASTAVEGSAVYVAMEKVSGTLQGRPGSFVLHHTGIMTRGSPQLTISVVPDSGTGELVGLAGTMDIQIEGGGHFFRFDYTLGESSSEKAKA
jgi:hypothetical protein